MNCVCNSFALVAFPLFWFVCLYSCLSVWIEEAGNGYEGESDKEEEEEEGEKEQQQENT